MSIGVFHAESVSVDLGLAVRVGFDIVRFVFDAPLESAIQRGIRQIVVYGSLVDGHVSQSANTQHVSYSRVGLVRLN